jgi:hypothetical protein
MKIVQARKSESKDWVFLNKQDLKKPLVLVFGNRYLLEDTGIHSEIKKIFPDGHLVFGSTSGEILSNKVFDDSIVITAIEFEKSSFVI